MFGDEWRRRQQQIKDKAKESEGGPSYYILQHQRLGGTLVRLVLGAVASGDLTHTAQRAFSR